MSLGPATSVSVSRDFPAAVFPVKHGLSAVGVAWPATWGMSRAKSPVGGRRALHPEPLDHIRADALGNLLEQLALEQPELGRPGRRLGLHHQLTLTQRHRFRVLGHLGTDQVRPL